MDITEHPGADGLELRLVGRFDTTWADHVDTTIETAIRAGSHRILINLAGVDYISSMGLRVLVHHYKRLKAVQGTLLVVHPSDPMRAALQAVGLAEFLLGSGVESDTRSETATATTAAHVTKTDATYEVFQQPASAAMTCTLAGRPERLDAGGFVDADCRTLPFASGSLGLGLGAFGDGFTDCRNRFGEFLAAGGCAITMPTTDHGLADYVIEQGQLVPRVEALYAITVTGDFSAMVRFDAHADGPGTVGLSNVVDAAVEFAGTGTAAFVMLAESAGIVGATLRRSPAQGPASLELPGVRDWVSFTTERASERSLALIVGVATRELTGDAATFLRPMTTGSNLHAHVHGAVFPYRPVQRGELPLTKTVADLLASSTPRTVMHLMADTRPFEGVGETDLVRGAIWLGPLGTIRRA